MLESQYKFWENDRDRESRLKKTWLDLQRRQALGGVDAMQTEEQLELTEQIVELIRKVRWKVDQELVRHNKKPLFHEFYFGKYEKQEFLIDVDIEFYKIKKLLERNPRSLRDDPVISLDYHRIIELIRQKKLLELTSNIYDPESSFKVDWHDPDLAVKENRLLKQKQLQQYMKRQVLEHGMAADQGDRDVRDFELQQAQEVDEALSSKKTEIRQKKMLLDSFQKMASNITKKSEKVTRTVTVTTRGGEQIAETAGMLKKKTKKKKEKTLSAKLRLKEKKNK